jgi:hypothetical protein
VERGGSLVVADPSSPLEEASVAQGLPDQAAVYDGPLGPSCQAPWVSGVSDLELNDDPLLEVPSGAYACFETGGDAFAVSRTLGAGTVVSLGAADIWSNADLEQGDNALLAANLLAARPGFIVAWLSTPWVGPAGSQDLWSVVPERTKLFLAGLALVAVALALWRSRRLGRPVLEDPVVPVPGSELVLATGRLLERNCRYAESAAIIRDDLCTQLRARFGQAPGTEAATVADIAALRAGLPKDQVRAALCGPLPHKEQELASLAYLLQRIREEVLSGTTAKH